MYRIVILFCLCFSFQIKAYEDVQLVTDQYGDQLVYIDGLRDDLFRKYTIGDSRGPKWGEDIDKISSLIGQDFYERSTYWSEGGYPETECPHFSEEDFENTVEDVFYDFKWESVKKKEGSTKTLFYLVSFEIELNVNGSSKSCKYVQNESQKFVFLNRLDENGEPMYLGELLSLPPR